MRALRFVWRGVLAFDRVGSRIPQLIQIWLVELFFVLPLAFFVGKVLDIRGCCGVEGTHESLDGVFWGSLVVAAIAAFFIGRNLFRPRLIEGEWAPVTHADLGALTVYVPNRKWAVTYKYLTSHPSYALLLLLTLPIPLVMVWATQNHGDDVFYWRASGYAGLAIIGGLALLRLVAWYVVRAGRAEIEQAAGELGYSPRRLAWEVAWKPVLMLMVLIYGIGGVLIGWQVWSLHRTIDGLPLASTDVPAGDYARVEGTISGEPAYWAVHGTGRGGNNYSGAGVLVKLDEGGEVLLLAESLSVPDFVGVIKDVEGGRIDTQGKVISQVTPDQVTYYGFRLDAFPPASASGRVLVLQSYP